MANGNSTTLLWSAVGLGIAYVGYKKFVQPYVVIPVPAQLYLKRLLIVIKHVRIRGNEVQFDLSVNNPNDKPLTIKSVVGLVYMNNIPVGEVSNYGNTIITPNAETVIPLAVKLRTIAVITYLLNAIQGKKLGQAFIFKGAVNVNGTPLKVGEKYKLS